MLFGIYSGILFDVCFDVLPDILSGFCSGPCMPRLSSGARKRVRFRGWIGFGPVCAHTEPEFALGF